MRHQYRQIVEEIVEKNRKLLEASNLRNAAKAALAKADECVAFNRRSLKQSEMALRNLESKIVG